MKKLLALWIVSATAFAAVLFWPVETFAQDVAPAVTAAVDAKSQVLQLFITTVLPVLFTGLATLLGWVFIQLGRKYGTDAGATKKNQVLGHLFALAQSVVADLEATLKPQLLLATADGVLSPTEITALREAALERVKFLAGEKGLAEAQALLGMGSDALTQFLLGLIEKAVDGQPGKTIPTPPATSLNQALSAAVANSPS